MTPESAWDSWYSAGMLAMLGRASKGEPEGRDVPATWLFIQPPQKALLLQLLFTLKLLALRCVLKTLQGAAALSKDMCLSGFYKALWGGLHLSVPPPAHFSSHTVHLRVSQLSARGLVLPLPSPIPVQLRVLPSTPAPAPLGARNTTLCLGVDMCPGLLSMGQLQWHSTQLRGLGGVTFLVHREWAAGTVKERSSSESSNGTAYVTPQLGRPLELPGWWSMSSALASTQPPGAGERCALIAFCPHCSPCPGPTSFLPGGSFFIQHPHPVPREGCGWSLLSSVHLAGKA